MTDFKSWPVGKLQLYLRDHGITANGYRQGNLAKIAETIETLQIPEDPHFINDDLETTLRNRLKRAGCAFEDPFLLDGYTEDFSCLPDFTLYDIFNYLLLHRADYDKRKLKAYKSAEDYRLYYDGHVENLQMNAVNTTSPVCVLKANVKPTQRGKTISGKATYKAWIVVSKADGDVKAAYCDCIGGADGACRHIAACLYELEAFEKVSVTDGPCQWKKRPRGHDLPIPIHHLKILKPRRTIQTAVEQTPINMFDPRRPADRDCDEDKVKFFSNRLAQINPSARCLEFLEHENPSTSPTDLTEALQKLTITSKAKYFKVSCDESNSDILVDKFVSSLKFNDEDVALISKATLGQSDNQLWFDMRKGIITASHFQSIMNDDDPSDICQKIMGTASASKSKFQELAMDWGRRKEPKARELYMCAHGLKSKKCLSETGVIISTKYPWVGCSPDGVVKCKCHVNKVIEIKCPFSLRNKLPKEVVEMKTNLSNSITASSQYYAQVQGQLGILEMDKCDLVFYTSSGIAHIEVPFDQTYFDHLMQKLSSFFINHLAPYLLKNISIEGEVHETENRLVLVSIWCNLTKIRPTNCSFRSLYVGSEETPLYFLF